MTLNTISLNSLKSQIINDSLLYATIIKEETLMMSDTAYLLFEHYKIDQKWLPSFKNAISSVNMSIDDLSAMINAKYCEDKDIKDAYSRLAYYLMSREEYTDAHAFFEKDHLLSRQSWHTALMFAECKALKGDLADAFELISDIYMKHADAADGYCNLSWALFDKKRIDAVLAAAIVEEDIKLKRLLSISSKSKASKIFLSVDRKKAFEIVENIYNEKQTAHSQYAALAKYYLIEKDHANALECFAADIKKNKLHPEKQLEYAKLLADCNQWDEALSLINHIYKKDSSIKDGYSSMAAFFEKSSNYPEARRNYENDINSGRITLKSRAKYISLLFKMGETGSGYEHTEKLVANTINTEEGNSVYALLSSHSEYISTFLDKLTSILPQGAVSVNQKQKDTLSGLIRIWQNEILSKLNLIDKISYPLPAAIISFPRSGSNFIQNVITRSSGTRNCSIYLPDLQDLSDVVTLKSHSYSQEYLKKEWSNRTGRLSLPKKAIILQRDPRDIMISFMEFVKARIKTLDLDQNTFLSKVDYFLAANIKGLDYDHSISIENAFKSFVRDWSTPSELQIDEHLYVRYEDLTDKPDEIYKQIFEFLELDCKLCKSSLEEKVSLYSDSSKASRGKAHRWRTHNLLYSQIIKDVNLKLKNEIALWGY